MRSGPCVALTLILGGTLVPAESADSDLEHGFAQTVRPFVTTYCVGCHSGSAAPAGLDLKSYSTTAEVVRDLARWTAVAGRLKSEEMPPKAMTQPPAELRQQVIAWIQSVRRSEALKNAGDPGMVLLLT